MCVWVGSNGNFQGVSTSMVVGGHFVNKLGIGFYHPLEEMKLWIDDMRDAPDDTWTVIRKVQPAMEFLNHFGDGVEEISIDHDIENRPDDETFLPVAWYIALLVSSSFATGKKWKPKIRIHSDNPVGVEKMRGVFKLAKIDAPWEPYTSNAEFKTKYGLT